MKKLLVMIIVLFTTSCSVQNYYQIFKASTENGELTTGAIVFEDENCKVVYDLWDNGGNVGFAIFNKSKKDIVIDLTHTFFVINGITYDYFLDRTFSNSSSTGTSEATSQQRKVYEQLIYPYYRNIGTDSKGNSKSSSTSVSRSFNEKTHRTVLPGTSIFVSEYNITSGRYSNCELTIYPSRKQTKTLTFSKSNSPFVFKNVISYETGGIVSKMENKFYVSEITDQPEKGLFKLVTKSACGNQLSKPIRVFKESPPDKFYFKY